MTLKKWNMNFYVEHYVQKFSARMTQKGVFHILSDQIFQKLFKMVYS